MSWRAIVAAGGDAASRGRTLLVVALLAAVCALVAVSTLPILFRAPAAVTLCFFLPGWTLLQLLPFPRDLGLAERLLVIVGGSCVVLVLLVIALGMGRVPLTGPVFAIVLGSLVLAALIAVWLRTRDR